MSWIRFVYFSRSDSGLTSRWKVVRSNGDSVLAWIAWYAPWRRYAMHAIEGIVFDATCLREIADFCETETREHKDGRA
jgi:hypothetical protein